MKAKAFQIPALKKDITSSFAGALIFGPDFGVVSETAEQIAKMITPDLRDDFCVIRLTPAKIKEKKSIVLDEANALSLMGGRRVVWIKEADNTCAFVVEDVLAQIKTDAFILMTADNLMKNSVLRVAAENHPKFLTVACYADGERDIQNTISAYLNEAGRSVTPAAMTVLMERLTENRIATRRELEKLVTYLGDKKQADEADVRAIITSSSTTSFDTLCMAVAGGRQKEADEAYRLLLASGESSVGIVRVLIGYFNRLLNGATALNAGDSLESAAKKVLRAAQFKLESDVKRQLSLWKTSWILRALELLSETEVQTKTTAFPADLMVARTILLLTSVPAKAARHR